MKFLSKFGLISAGVLMLAGPALPVAAMGSSSDHVASTSTATESETKVSTTSSTTDTPETSTDPTDNSQTKSDTKKAAAKAKGAEAKLKACQNHEKVVTNIMSRISDRGQKQIDLFTKIATRTEDFYVSKGKTLSNYGALVADVNAKEAAAQAEVTAIANTTTTFTCDGTNDKAKVTEFKDSLKAEISALKDYKTAVKNLIVGIKSVQSTTADTTVKTDTSTGGNQ